VPIRSNRISFLYRVPVHLPTRTPPVTLRSSYLLDADTMTARPLPLFLPDSEDSFCHHVTKYLGDCFECFRTIYAYSDEVHIQIAPLEERL
jgi:hypothetical protein